MSAWPKAPILLGRSRRLLAGASSLRRQRLVGAVVNTTMPALAADILVARGEDRLNNGPLERRLGTVVQFLFLLDHKVTTS